MPLSTANLKLPEENHHVETQNGTCRGDIPIFSFFHWYHHIFSDHPCFFSAAEMTSEQKLQELAGAEEQRQAPVGTW